MIILFGKFYGKDTSELDSGYLIWVIESYDKADWSLIQACKQELFDRLKLDWQPPTPESKEIELLKYKQITLLQQIDTIEKCLIMATCFNATRIEVDGYLRNKEYLNQQLKLIRQVNS